MVERGEVPFIREALETLGPEKILYGSDSCLDGPITKVAFWQQRLAEIQASPAAIEQILGENAEALITASGFDPRRIVLSDQ